MKGSTKMIVIKENERLYATSWQYNSARILTRLAQLITAQGGKVKPLYPAVISDRNLEEACTATQHRIESSSTFHPKVREPLISNLQKELALFQAIPHTPITVTHTSYINFTMNGVYYSYSLDNNPLFPFHYLKTPIEPKSETYSGDACMEESPKSWFTDPLIGFGCPDSEIESAAGAILSLLIAAPLSTIRHDAKRTRIPNTYNSGSHFETIPIKERRIKIDF
jgi:hypothetical protein